MHKKFIILLEADLSLKYFGQIFVPPTVSHYLLLRNDYPLF
jgi:hypothetical protein